MSYRLNWHKFEVLYIVASISYLFIYFIIIIISIYLFIFFFLEIIIIVELYYLHWYRNKLQCSWRPNTTDKYNTSLKTLFSLMIRIIIIQLKMQNFF